MVKEKRSREGRGDGDRSLVSRAISETFLDHVGLDPGLGSWQGLGGGEAWGHDPGGRCGEQRCKGGNVEV